MKKLNNKGYITVEILIASIIAAVIAVFLIGLTVKLVSKTDDAYIDTVLTTDKVLITNQIMNDINSRGLYDLGYIRQGDSESGLLFTFSDGTEKELYVDKIDDKHRLIYGNQGESYKKNFNIKFSQIEYNFNSNDGNDYIGVNLTLKTIYSDKNYGFYIAVPKYYIAVPKYYDITVVLEDRSNSNNVISTKKYKVSAGNVMYQLQGNLSEFMDVNGFNNINDYYDIIDVYCNKSDIMGQYDTFYIDVNTSDICQIGVCPNGEICRAKW